MNSNYWSTAIVETVKDFGRWIISYFVAWFVPNGFAWIMAFFAKAHYTPSAMLVLLLTVFFKYLDYAKHKAAKSDPASIAGQSYGLFGF